MASMVDPFKKVSVHVSAGGQIFWYPSPTYTRGLKHKFTNVLLYEITSFDKYDWFYAVTGERPSIVDAYYIIPMEEVETGLRKLEDDTSIREMILAMKDHDTLNIWLEKSHRPITSVTPNRIESSSGLNISDHDPLLNHGDQVFIDVEAPEEEEEEYFSDADGKLAEDFEDPADDDIFEERPDDHSRKAWRKYRVALRAEQEQEAGNKSQKRKGRNNEGMEQSPMQPQEDQVPPNETHANSQAGPSRRTTRRKKVQKEPRKHNQQPEEKWYSDDGSGGSEELDKGVDSDDEKPEDILNAYEEYKVLHYPNYPKDFKLKVGMMFASRSLFKQVIRDWAISKGWNLEFTKRSKTIICGKCRSEECTWKFRASCQQNSSTFQVKSVHGEHKCSFLKINPLANYKWMAMRIARDIRDMPTIELGVLKLRMSEDHDIDVTLHVAYRAKRYALEMINGNIKQQYAILYDYCATFCKHNPDSHLYIQRNREVDPPAFERMYFGIKGLRDGFRAGCRPFIGVDGCFLKGPYKGQLLSAIGRDGNDNLYTIAMAVVGTKSKDTWNWFLNHLRNDIGQSFNGDVVWTFISDRQKGLLDAVEEVFGADIEHRYCLRHMYNNFKTKFRGLDMKQKFWEAASVAN